MRPARPVGERTAPEPALARKPAPTAGPAPRRRPSGVREVIGYNWPLYAGGALAAAEIESVV